MNRNDALDILKTGDPGSRILAARELRRWNDPDSKRALVDALGDSLREVRDAAARTLMEIGDASTVPYLLPLLRSGDPAARNGARQVLEQLGRIDPPSLVELSRDGDVRMRVFAANIMGGTGDHDFVAVLVGLLRDDDSNVIEAATSALGQLGAREAVAGLRGVVLHPDVWLRFSAIDALGRIADPAASRALLELLPDAETDLLEPVIEALGRQGSTASVIPLVGLLEKHFDLQPSLLRILLGPLAPHVASLGRDSRLAPLARAATAALRSNQLPPRLASTTAVLLAAIGNREGA